jgi:hypothetical protein
MSATASRSHACGDHGRRRSLHVFDDRQIPPVSSDRSKLRVAIQFAHLDGVVCALPCIERIWTVA